MKKIFAVTALAPGLGAFAIPASANQSIYSARTNYLQNGPSCSVPYSSNAGRDFRAIISYEPSANDNPVMREQLFH